MEECLIYKFVMKKHIGRDYYIKANSLNDALEALQKVWQTTAISSIEILSGMFVDISTRVPQES